jgi:NADPH2:quinone reductase
MQAIVLVRHGSEREAFQLQERSAPDPGPGQLRVAVEAFGLNYADV